MKIAILLLIVSCLNLFCKGQTNVLAAAALSENGISDPILTGEMVADFPFIKPTMPMQKALKIAEARLRKNIVDLKHYFLIEANMIDPEKGPAFNWHFKWIRWGVRQRDNTPLEITVTNEGKIIRDAIQNYR